MTIATHRSQSVATGLISFLNDRLHHARKAVQLARKRRLVFRSTLNELCDLSNRELADIGIPRTQVRRVAREAAMMVQADE